MVQTVLIFMAGPYDYSINIPQPPAQNFLQSLMGIRQLQQMEEQSAIQQQQAAIQQQNAAFQQQMQPLERQKLEAAIAAQRASTAQSGAATNLLGVQTTGAKLALADKQLISSTLRGYANDKTKTIEDLIPILPLLDATAVENIGKAEQIRVNREVDTALREGKEITANDIRGWSNRQTLLKGPEQQQFQQSFLAMTPQFKEAAKTGMISAVNAAFAGNMGEARKAAAEVQQALINSKDSSPASKSVSNSFGKIVDLIDQDPNLPKEVLALNVVNAAGLIGEPKLAEETLKVYKEFGDFTKPGGTGKGKEVDEEERAQKLKKGELDIEKEKLQIKEIQQKLDQTRDEKIKVFASTNKFAKELSDASITNRQSADAAMAILEKIDSGEVQIPNTVKGAIWQYVKDKIPLLSNDVSMLRKEYQKLANSEVIKSLPPGSASDADRRFAQEGIMSKDANPKQFRKGVEAMARLSDYASRYNEAKLAWVSQNAGSAGSALKEFSVFGAPIKKGSAFNAWWNKEGNKLDQNFMPDQAGTGVDVNALLNKYR
jgi:hypothetical protein